MHLCVRLGQVDVMHEVLACNNGDGDRLGQVHVMLEVLACNSGDGSPSPINHHRPSP